MNWPWGCVATTVILAWCTFCAVDGVEAFTAWVLGGAEERAANSAR
ncbi:hypothetical protein AB0I28_38475 [Phytomonospora sp. NPDC050363]